MKSPLRIISYVRELSVEEDKFTEFDRMLEESRGRADAIAISAPQVLGDTYGELLTNLEKLAKAEFMLLIVPPSQRPPGHKLN